MSQLYIIGYILSHAVYIVIQLYAVVLLLPVVGRYIGHWTSSIVWKYFGNVVEKG